MTEHLLIDGQIYPLPQGYAVTLTPNEKVNTLTVSTGELRQDIYRRACKIKLSYNNLLQADYSALLALREATLHFERFSVVLADEAGEAVYYPVNRMAAVTSRYQSRIRGFYVYQNVEAEFE
jgi:hypothetical protein